MLEKYFWRQLLELEVDLFSSSSAKRAPASSRDPPANVRTENWGFFTKTFSWLFRVIWNFNWYNHPTSRQKSSSSTELRKANQSSSWSTTSSSRRTWVIKINPKTKKTLFNRAVGELGRWSSWRRRCHAGRLLHRRRHRQLGGYLGLVDGSILTAGRIALNNFFAIHRKSESCC